MTDFPRSLLEFQQRFGDEAACAQYLATARWPDGFVCPGCGGGRAWRLETKAWTYECADCGCQTSVTAGTIMHHSKLPLTAWFWAAYLMAIHSNGISALQLQGQLAFGSYKTAWLLCAKLRRSMFAPGRSPLAGLVEVDEHDPHVVGKMAAHIVLPWVHRIFSNLKVWALGVYHGLRRKHLQSYLDEFVFRFNRRRTRHAAFRSLLGIAAGHQPAPYKMFISPEAKA